MTFKDWGYKRKGTVIGGIIGFLIGWLGFFILTGRCNGFADSVSCSFGKALIWPGHLITGVFLLIVGLVIGVVVGIIIEKVKSK